MNEIKNLPKNPFMKGGRLDLDEINVLVAIGIKRGWLAHRTQTAKKLGRPNNIVTWEKPPPRWSL